jgi:hypothetical protein
VTRGRITPETFDRQQGLGADCISIDKRDILHVDRVLSRNKPDGEREVIDRAAGYTVAGYISDKHQHLARPDRIRCRQLRVRIFFLRAACCQNHRDEDNRDKKRLPLHNQNLLSMVFLIMWKSPRIRMLAYLSISFSNSSLLHTSTTSVLATH